MFHRAANEDIYDDRKGMNVFNMFNPKVYLLGLGFFVLI